MEQVSLRAETSTQLRVLNASASPSDKHIRTCDSTACRAHHQILIEPHSTFTAEILTMSAVSLAGSTGLVVSVPLNQFIYDTET